MKLLRLVGVMVALTPLHESAFAQPATATTTSGRNPDGSTRISIAVNPGGQLVKDVHLCVARTKHTPTKETTLAGDPLNRNYSNPAGAAGWTYQGVVETQEPAAPGAAAGETTSKWCVTWTNPGAGLGAPSTFAVDYSGGKGDVDKSAKENLFLTNGGTNTFAPNQVVNGPGAAGGKKGEKGHMPVPAFTTSAPSLTPPVTTGEQQQLKRESPPK